MRLLKIGTGQYRLLTLAAIRFEEASPDWPVLARTAQLADGLDMLYRGVVPEDSRDARRTQTLLQRAFTEASDTVLAGARERVDRELEVAARVKAKLTTVLDDDYPVNLRLVPNLSPFLFYRGSLEARDAYSIAVVGTRQASEIGRARAARMARELCERGVRIYSGLAKGIDTAAHTATLDAGGRTLAVIGTGISKCYPAENRTLMERIADNGAVISQFWPSASGATWTFPRRNITMSGLSQATCVIEAGHTSGAKLQARYAYEHGKRVFLIRSLVQDQPWAAKMLADGKATEVEDSKAITRHLADPDRIAAVAESRQQLAIDLFAEDA